MCLWPAADVRQVQPRPPQPEWQAAVLKGTAPEAVQREPLPHDAPCDQHGAAQPLATLLMPNGLPRGERLTQGTHNGTHRNTHRNTQWNTQWNSHAMEPAMHAPSSDLHAASAWSLHGRLLIRAYIVRGTCVVRMWCICICATGGRRLAARVVQHTGRVRLSRRRGCVLIIAYPYYSVPLL